MNFMETIIFPLFIFWIIGLIYSFLRKELEIHIKFISILIFFFYIYTFQDELILGFVRLKKSYAKEVISWIYGFSKASYFYLLLAWPITLIRIFFSAAHTVSKLNLIILIYYTIFYFTISLIYTNFQVSIDNFLQNFLVQFLSF